MPLAQSQALLRAEFSRPGLSWAASWGAEEHVATRSSQIRDQFGPVERPASGDKAEPSGAVYASLKPHRWKQNVPALH